ncbi:hypothetical protein F8M49_29880 [Rhodococcus zopfii]|uniref:Core-binding (CB) domain-containing protein n=1 Tax=Rhodococcus zopfii TaxID=43772 RepID=A0ABU3WX43_9NOCA|nr:hypothetical protein [Rhodococcus zopfii]
MATVPGYSGAENGRLNMSRRASGEGALYQRADGMWIGTVDLPPGEDGKRRRRTVSSKDYATAVQKLRKLHREIEDGAVNPAKVTQTVDDWLTHWLDNIAARQLNPRTLQTYRSAVKKNISPHIGTTKLVKLTPAKIRSMHTKVIAGGRSTRTAEIAHRILSKALKDAVREGLLTKNIAENVPAPKVLSKERGSLTTDQARAVLRNAFDRGDSMATRYAAALLTGARQGGAARVAVGSSGSRERNSRSVMAAAAAADEKGCRSRIAETVRGAGGIRAHSALPRDRAHSAEDGEEYAVDPAADAARGSACRVPRSADPE